MSSGLFLKTAVCSTYDRLLQRCMAKFEVWASRRQESCEVGLHCDEKGAELLRLQADYAKSYNDLCKHVGGYEFCQAFPGTSYGDGARDEQVMPRRGSSVCDCND